MREKLNSDPKTQAIAVLVLIALAAFFFVSKSGGEEEEPAITEATVSVAGTEATGTAVGATPGAAVEGAVEEAVAGASAEATSASASVPPAVPSTLQAPPLPEPMRDAYKAGETVVLLIVHNGGIDDRIVEGSIQSLEGEEGVALFVAPAKQVYRYASITLGVEVSRVPALIVMRPRKLSEGAPQASVAYGFQTSQDVVQAVRDADYHGPVATYHPD